MIKGFGVCDGPKKTKRPGNSQIVRIKTHILDTGDPIQFPNQLIPLLFLLQLNIEQRVLVLDIMSQMTYLFCA